MQFIADLFMYLNKNFVHLWTKKGGLLHTRQEQKWNASTSRGYMQSNSHVALITKPHLNFTED